MIKETVRLRMNKANSEYYQAQSKKIITSMCSEKIIRLQLFVSQTVIRQRLRFFQILKKTHQKIVLTNDSSDVSRFFERLHVYKSKKHACNGNTKHINVVTFSQEAFEFLQ